MKAPHSRHGHQAKPATIKDIARELGVSITTVSRAMRDFPDVNPQTRQAVLDMARQLDYQPNQVALSLVTSHTNSIGVIVPNLDYFFATAVRGIDELAIEAGYTVLTCQSNESYGREITNTQRLMNGRVDGLIVSLSSETSNVDHFRRLLQRSVPMVFFDRVGTDLEATKVMLDNYDGAVQAVSHLYEQGCRRIAYLAGPASLSISNQRKKGYLGTLEKYGLSVREELIVHCPFDQAHAYRATLALLDGPERPDAIFAISDRIAVGALLALRERGVAVPEEVALVGFNDEPVAALLTPALSSVGQPAFEMGRLAAQLFIEQMNSDELMPPKTELLKPRLVVRESSLKRGR
ncbi:LacI family DNA-binding transcriptional regulator [Hymenobacter psychrophilus]|uniref:Transcriptional regulator, LacI family n=1 Tax=Hymenobacter psychrophilus TaxID=651662 RepID=A0A1H3LAT2_9BACT|nr:LacI family DNA-binding transcriptional regulator [Hymenobacter psychrophilus]SDY61491.1 transcriptional regulator, LacI family [Hymenobacter psychrophilus]